MPSRTGGSTERRGAEPAFLLNRYGAGDGIGTRDPDLRKLSLDKWRQRDSFSMCAAKLEPKALIAGRPACHRRSLKRRIRTAFQPLYPLVNWPKKQRLTLHGAMEAFLLSKQVSGCTQARGADLSLVAGAVHRVGPRDQPARGAPVLRRSASGQLEGRAADIKRTARSRPKHPWSTRKGATR